MPSSERVTLAVDPIGSRHGRALCEAAVTLATTGEAAAIIAVTREGKTARLLSSLRPARHDLRGNRERRAWPAR